MDYMIASGNHTESVASAKAVTEGEKPEEIILSPSQPVRLTAPSSEGAFGWRHPCTHVLVNDPTTGYGIFIENMLDAAA